MITTGLQGDRQSPLLWLLVKQNPWYKQINLPAYKYPNSSLQFRQSSNSCKEELAIFRSAKQLQEGITGQLVWQSMELAYVPHIKFICLS